LNTGVGKIAFGNRQVHFPGERANGLGVRGGFEEGLEAASAVCDEVWRRCPYRDFLGNGEVTRGERFETVFGLTLDQTDTASAGSPDERMIAERGNFDTVFVEHIDEAGAFGDDNSAAIDDDLEGLTIERAIGRHIAPVVLAPDADGRRRRPRVFEAPPIASLLPAAPGVVSLGEPGVGQRHRSSIESAARAPWLNA
jgi:hypothetical protein